MQPANESLPVDILTKKWLVPSPLANTNAAERIVLLDFIHRLVSQKN